MQRFVERKDSTQQNISQSSSINPFTNVTPPPTQQYSNNGVNMSNQNQTQQQRDEEEEDIFDIPAFLRQRN